MYKTVVNVTGMACPMCEAHVNEAIKKNFDVESVNSSHVESKTEIVSKDVLSNDLLKKVISDEGYIPGDISISDF